MTSASTGRAPRAVLGAIVLLAWAPGPAPAAGAAAGHLAADATVATPAEERAMELSTNAATAIDAAAAEASTPDAPHVVGRWSPAAPWPVLGVHSAVLPDGRVLAYDSVGDELPGDYPESQQTTTRATLWDPETGRHERVDLVTGVNVFCSGMAHLTDGSLFLSGGNRDPLLNGIPQNHVFDAGGNAWHREAAEMRGPRWYPTVTALTSGEMLITSGLEDTPEVRGLDGSLRPLEGATRRLALYPWMDVAPDGRVFMSGPEAALGSLDTAGGGAWEDRGPRDTIDREYGSHAMYDVGRTLVSGGGRSTASARVIDTRASEPVVSATEPMAAGRRHHNLTVLADGSVPATGGNHSGAGHVDVAAGVYAAERWVPATGR